jgi:hypothetical protein
MPFPHSSFGPLHEHIVLTEGSLNTQEGDENHKEDKGESLHHNCALDDDKQVGKDGDFSG